VRVLGVGAGYFAQFHYESWKRLDGVELCGVCDLDRARAEAVGGAPVFTDLDDALAQSGADLVDLITPPGTRLALAEKVAASGLPMILQKPLADDLAGARAIAALSAGTGATMLVHENFRFQPWYREARRLLDAGLLGDPVSVASRMRPGDGRGPDAYLARQPYFQTMPRFLIHETAIHFIDTFRFLMGEVGEVFADLRRLNPAIAGEDAGIVLFRFAGGGRGVFDGNRLGEFESENPRLTMGEMWLEGAEARLRLSGDGQIWLKPNGKPERRHDYAWEDRGFGGDCVHAFQRHALAHFADAAPAETRVSDYIRNVEIEEAVYLSAAEGRWIAVGSGGQ
jgi:predicted dehydrogenase